MSAKTVLSLDEVAMFTGLSKHHLYKLTSAKQIPHYKPNGRIMYFDKQEVTEWMKRNRIATAEEAEQTAAAYLMKGGRR